MDKCRTRGSTVRALGGSSDNLVPIAPLQFESPVGQLLAQVLQTHAHLLPAAIDQQLENLQTDKDIQREDTSQDLLYQNFRSCWKSRFLAKPRTETRSCSFS